LIGLEHFAGRLAGGILSSKRSPIRSINAFGKRE